MNKQNKIFWNLSWNNPNLVIKHVSKYKNRNKNKDRGYAVFTKKNIQKNEILTIFGGYVIPLEKIQQLDYPLEEYFYQIHEKFFYGPINKNQISLSEYYNHSCDPNAGFKDIITLIAIKKIKKDTEICIDYATLLTINNFNFKCECGVRNCRGIITGNDWKIKTLQKKYKNYFQPYILKKILKNNK